MTADLPVLVTYLILLDFVLLAVVAPRLHFGIRFAALFGQAFVLGVLGVVAPDVYFGAFPPLDEVLGSFNGWMLGIMAFVISFPVAVVAWGIRRLMGRKA